MTLSHGLQIIVSVGIRTLATEFIGRLNVEMLEHSMPVTILPPNAQFPNGFLDRSVKNNSPSSALGVPSKEGFETDSFEAIDYRVHPSMLINCVRFMSTSSAERPKMGTSL